MRHMGVVVVSSIRMEITEGFVLKGWNVSTLMTSGVQLRPIVDIQTQLVRDDKF